MKKMEENNKSELHYKELVKIQTMFRDGLIKEEDLSDDVIKELEELYHNQIESLKKSIEKDRQEIIKIRKKIRH